ncbi:neuraminidase-like domain-containing protein [Glycomyces mayteni]|uniref:Neuraminidase-like domain-containing protein n=1 Tax=Glycomyces mayteni TaxID=543887 RepID=A0ABW2DGU7_9ACTN
MTQPKRHFSPEAIRKLTLPVETAAAPPGADPDRTMAIQLPGFVEEPTGGDVAALQASLTRLRHEIDPEELAESRLGPSTRDAVRRLQAAAGLIRTGVVTPETAGQIKRELEHRYFTDAPHRAAKIQALLTALGHRIDDAELSSRKVGTSTAAAIQQFRQRTKSRGVSWWLDEALVERLRAEALAARLGSRTQFGKAQRTLVRALTVAKLDVTVGADELRARQAGPGTQAALRAFQAKYRLPASGRFDLATMDKLDAVAASKPAPVKTLKVKSALGLSPLKRGAKLNMRGGHVAAAQKALAHFGYAVPMSEHGEARYGKATREAVLAFQAAKRLPQTGALDGPTVKALNRDVLAALPASEQPLAHYRLRGSVRDDRWRPVKGAKVRLAFRSLAGEGQTIGTRVTGETGFYDLPYDPPRDPNTKEVAKPLHLVVTFTGPDNAPLGSRILFNPTPIQWTNQTAGDRPYRGPSLYETQRAALDAVLGGLGVTDLVEDGERNDVTVAALESGLTQYEVMRLVLAVRAAKHVGDSALGAAVYFGFISQGLPATLPEELLAATDEWTRIDELTAATAAAILLLGPEKQAEAFARAADDNLVPIALVRDEEAVLAALNARSVTAVLDAPAVGGDASLRSLLDSSALAPAHYDGVAAMLLAHGETSEAFWTDLTGAAGDLGGPDVVADVAAAVETAAIADGFAPVAALLKARIDDPGVPDLTTTRQLARLSTAEWDAVVADAGHPAGEGAETYARKLEATAAAHYPTTALIAELGRTDGHGLALVDQAAAFIDAHPDLELKATGLDAYARSAEIDLDPDLRSEMRVQQRAVRLAPDHKTGAALLAEHLHSAGQIASLDRAELAAKLKGHGVDDLAVAHVHSAAQIAYAHVLGQVAAFRSDHAPGQAQALGPQQITLADATGVLGDVPDLALLFGGLDYCDCGHCESVYGPAAYLADLLRFLSTRPAKATGPATVLSVLQARRPDIDDLLLNCPNTDTALPYIDLVNELLERAAAPGAAQPQTTRTAAELRAVPEHLHAPAYEAVKAARFPVRGAFNAWQEEARVILAHLGVPRHELMRLLGPGTPDALASAAAEYFGLSTLDASLVTVPAPTQPDQDDVWGLDTGDAAVGVLPFLHHAGLAYAELLDLLDTTWVHGAGTITLERPDGTCDLELQTLSGLGPARYDRVHRFIRLWRHTKWTPKQLDRLLRAPGIGGGALDAAALRRLAAFAELAKRLRLPFEAAITLYAPLSTEPGPDGARSPYADLFANPNLLDPPDPAFDLPLTGTEPMADHRPALAAAWRVGEADLDLLLARTGPNLTVADLTVPLRHTVAAEALRLPVAEYLALIDLAAAELPDPYAGPDATLALADRHAEAKAAGLTVSELDWLLNDRPDAPYGQRAEAITEQLDALRESLRTTPAEEVNGQIAATVAATFSLPDGQAVTLLDLLRPGLWDVFANPALMAQNEDGEYTHPLTETEFPDLFHTWRLLHKAAYLVRRMRIDATDLPWLMDRAAASGWLHPGAVPAGPADPPASLQEWRRLAAWLVLRHRYPRPEESGWPEVFDAAAAGDPVADVRAAVEALTGWHAADLAELDGDDPAFYADVDALTRVRVAAEALRRLAVPAADALRWVDRDDDTGGAQRLAAEHLRQTMKSKYDTGAWLALMPELQDPLREARRDALTAYLVEHSLRTTAPTITAEGREWANPRHWKDTADLQRWFLLDTEMTSVQLTSRLKQAISSVQLFAQRCLLNLELPLVRITAAQTADTTSLDSWSQWEWMSGYRLWEANRKVFLYPENWIEAELRDDKTPFFKELEDRLSQGELTDANAEAAYRDYLRKLVEVAHMQTLGIYHQQTASGNRLHVVARSASQPSHCYYRSLDLAYNEWTGWERIDVDIASDQVVPVVYRDRLHLFWLQFEEKTQQPKRQPPAQITDSPNPTADPAGTLEIELAWSERTPDGWTARRTSGEKLIHPWPRPRSSYTLKPRHRSNQLWLDVYISSSIEFNNGRFYDEFTDSHERLTRRQYSSLHWPWHSSSYVFTGEVLDLKMKPMYGNYTRRSDGTLFTADSLWHVQTNFGEKGRGITALTSAERSPKLRKPATMRFANGRLAALGSAVDVMVGFEDTRKLLSSARQPAELVLAPHARQFNDDPASPMVFQDRERAYWVRRTQVVTTVPMQFNGVAGPFWIHVPVVTLGHRWYPFWHPHASDFLAALDTKGVEGLVTRPQQSIAPSAQTQFAYGPQPGNAVDPTAQGGVDFTRGGAYSAYNWELFFHAPMLIAAKLTAEQRFEEAMRWYHRIFDPTSTDGDEAPQRYWVTKPFFDNTSEDYRQQRIESILGDIGDHLDELRAWKNHPFSPHTVARYRPVAYQKAIVMKYLDNLIGWADQQFRRDTLESINQAVLLYTLAAEILGRRPESVPPPERADKSYAQLTAEGALDPFGNQDVAAVLEGFAPPLDLGFEPDEGGGDPLPHLEVKYFGIPVNDKLLGYWDTVADRLFKVRHGLNIEGVFRQLPLFEPPLDPGMLVKAAAAGADLSSVLGLFTAVDTRYRFRVLAARAAELLAELRALGDKLLRVLETRDAEELALLRATQEAALNRAIQAVRDLQMDEATADKAALEAGRAAIDARIAYHGSVPRMNGEEIAAVVMQSLGLAGNAVAAVMSGMAGGASLIPDFSIGIAGFGGSPNVSMSIGGSNISGFLSNTGAMIGGFAGMLMAGAGMAETQGRYTRDFDEHQFSRDVAAADLAQLEAQLAAAAIREQIATAEANNQLQATADAEAVEEYLRSKYTDKELYDWMLGKIATVYFQAYQIAFDTAMLAQQSYQFELAEPDASFIQFGYWDSLRKGLLAPERLTNDLRRMESSYMEKHLRDLELTKHVSLAQVDPLALLALKLTGQAAVLLPEWLFDLDYPGHYRRRLKSVALSVPCVVGPYTSVNCTLAVTNNGVRLDDSVAGGYGDPLAGGDPRFWKSPVPTTAIATSHAVNDRGMFELRFDDERFLPFEGAGAVSEWTLSLPKANNQFDLGSITDVVLHLDYTARAGGPGLAALAAANIDDVLPTSGAALFALEEQFGTAWHRMLHPEDGEDQELVFTLAPEHLPYWARVRAATEPVKVSAADLVLDTVHTDAFTVKWRLPGQPSSSEVPGANDPAFGGAPHSAVAPVPAPPMLGEWRMGLKRASAVQYDSLLPEDVRRAYLLVQFDIG